MRRDAGFRAKGEELTVSKAAEYLLDECRMVLPGIQALFGFQLIAVFSPAFADRLSQNDRGLHLLALALVALAIALIMAPAAIHRQKGSYQVTDLFIRVCSRLLLWSMVPLAVSISLEFYLVARIVLGAWWAVLLAAGLAGVFAVLWFVLPRYWRMQRAIAGG